MLHLSNAASSRAILALAGACLLTACAEPTDCTVEPQRCIAPSVSEARPAPAVPLQPQQRPAPAVPLQPQQRPALAQPPAAAQALPQAEAVRPERVPAREPVQALAGVETADALLARGVIVGMRAPAAAHDMAALKQHMTKRLTADLVPKLDKYAERLWKHLDRYVKAVDGGKFTVASEPADTPTRRQVTITLPDGGELKPILEREDNAWKIDRF